MPKIPMPKRTITPSGKGPEAQVPYRPDMPAGRERMEFGRALMRLGGVVSDLAVKMKAAETQESYANATIDYLDAEKEKLIELEKDRDFSGRMDKYESWSELQEAAVVAGIKDSKAKEKFILWVKNHRVNEATNIGLKAWNEEYSFIKGDARRKLNSWIRAGDKNAAYEHADELLDKGIFSEAETQEFKNDFDEGYNQLVKEQMIDAVLKTAEGIQDNLGTEAAIQYIEEIPTEQMELKEKRTAMELIKYFDKVKEVRQEEFDTKMQEAQIKL